MREFDRIASVKAGKKIEEKSDETEKVDEGATSSPCEIVGLSAVPKGQFWVQTREGSSVVYKGTVHMVDSQTGHATAHQNLRKGDKIFKHAYTNIGKVIIDTVEIAEILEVTIPDEKEDLCVFHVNTSLPYFHTMGSVDRTNVELMVWSENGITLRKSVAVPFADARYGKVRESFLFSDSGASGAPIFQQVNGQTILVGMHLGKMQKGVNRYYSYEPPKN